MVRAQEGEQKEKELHGSVVLFLFTLLLGEVYLELVSGSPRGGRVLRKFPVDIFSEVPDGALAISDKMSPMAAFKIKYIKRTFLARSQRERGNLQRSHLRKWLVFSWKFLDGKPVLGLSQDAQNT